MARTIRHAVLATFALLMTGTEPSAAAGTAFLVEIAGLRGPVTPRLERHAGLERARLARQEVSAVFTGRVRSHGNGERRC